jgi:hypothetical protein
MPIVPVEQPPRDTGAACAGIPTEVFYERKHLAHALKVCGTCPLAERMACLQEEMARPAIEQYGVRGGLIASHRKKILKAWRQAGYVPTRKSFEHQVMVAALIPGGAACTPGCWCAWARVRWSPLAWSPRLSTGVGWWAGWLTPVGRRWSTR